MGKLKYFLPESRFDKTNREFEFVNGSKEIDKNPEFCFYAESCF